MLFPSLREGHNGVLRQVFTFDATSSPPSRSSLDLQSVKIARSSGPRQSSRKQIRQRGALAQGIGLASESDTQGLATRLAICRDLVPGPLLIHLADLPVCFASSACQLSLATGMGACTERWWEMPVSLTQPGCPEMRARPCAELCARSTVGWWREAIGQEAWARSPTLPLASCVM